jgi:hypothetical protein
VVVSTSGTLKATGASSYDSGSQQLSFFTAMNAARIGAGAGAVDQNTAIDTAAQAHADYLSTNLAAATAAGESPHTENPIRSGYYAAVLGDRMSKGGFSWSFATEVIGGTGPSLTADGCALGLLGTVYHGADMLSEETSVGIGMGTDAAGVPMCVADMGTKAPDSVGQVPAAGAFIAYPYDTQTNVLETFCASCEIPRPSPVLFPDPAPVTYVDVGGVSQTYQPNALVGTPVIVRIRNADFVNFQLAGSLNATVTQFQLKDSAGNVVPAGILAHSALKAGAGVALNADTILGPGFAILVPFAPLAKATTYTVTFSATLKSGGAALTRTWSFTTAS